MLETNTKEKPFERTKPKSVRSISLLVARLEGFNHRPLSIGSITRRLHYGPWLLFRGQRWKCSDDDAQSFIDRLWGGKCFYRCDLVCTKMTLHVWVSKLCKGMSLQTCSSHQPLNILYVIRFLDYIIGHISPFLCSINRTTNIGVVLK